MAELVREPIGLRVLIRALRPEDDTPLWLWRAHTQLETAALIEAGESDDRATLWAALLRWSEAKNTAEHLTDQGWNITFRGVRAIALERATNLFSPPQDDEGWLLTTASLTLRVVPETMYQDEEIEIMQLLSFLDQ
ncbi:MAG: hypothetical protein GFH27_549415n38 [Chloroflexi bacterium AL-W]|nr:hypothetical protein [Chloroflexi bacterium AL-N1]NOK71486.1 hypothetical protein [Chloroflexi bacterium AL-N10]NOK77267.1 hypothetical protein [Chloroflexi bacterium AL-N5]NOK86307.1 hypothetical protein [Chloroflexi bacterium AL-W]NOK93277.1 hypothetical protein [Chloroflexi bacterium AL-N15]